MVLGGLWHGAGWTFIFWGFLHGIYLLINHLWIGLRKSLHVPVHNRLYTHGMRGLTFVAVVVSWTFFRAADLDTALSIIGAMIGQHGIAWPIGKTGEPGYLAGIFSSVGVRFTDVPLFGGVADIFIIALLTASVWVLPNTHQIFGRAQKVLAGRSWQLKTLRWQPNTRWAVALSFLAVLALLRLESVREFLYFQF
jgi:hypothetical protein